MHTQVSLNLRTLFQSDFLGETLSAWSPLAKSLGSSCHLGLLAKHKDFFEIAFELTDFGSSHYSALLLNYLRPTIF